jgi:tetratricopeptide (TPR) repeat protein
MRRFVLAFFFLSALLGAPPAVAAHGDHGAATAAAPDVPTFTGLGGVHHEISSRAPEAQRFFDQGLRLCYAFNHDEAIRSFERAAAADSTCAVCWWGVALALGPNINLPMSPEAEQKAVSAIEHAQSLASGASEAERAYIEALSKRYALPAGENRARRDSSYADAMRALMKRYRSDSDAATLCAEALMDLRPWNLWTLGGAAQPGTPEIVAILESVMKRDPDHTGALHLYIHTIEASPNPERAEAAADRLATLTPEAGHLIHMPTHIYLRVGRYDDAARLNERAVAVDRAYINRWNVQSVYRMMYYPHNIHMRWSALCSQGRSKDAEIAARELAEAVPFEMVREMQPVEFFRAPVYLTAARFGRWDDILAGAAPAAEFRVSSAVWHYARGLAHAAKGAYAAANAERDSVAAIAGALPADAYFGLNPAAPLLRFAAAHLEGEIAARGGRTADAIRLLSSAAGMQDSLLYDEPPPWPMTARQSLGAALLASGRAADAAEVYRQDLKRYPENGWSLYGLGRAVKAQKASREAAALEARFKKAWAKADVALTASRF